ncbi:GMC oxidoreductase [Glomus cerebriforme]|uniref:GMC oxidoreductase n=1 Tax=Glomus cerebriforme TaxID=658196 RepID=A0A397SRG9_9GLOM|nr:GMC oxidoreductase [Glomus cerebriforme]
MLSRRGQKADYDLWASQGPEYKIWDYDHCLEAFKAIENNARENPDEEFKKYHGFNGLLHVQDNSYYICDIIKDVVKVAKNLGIPYNNDFNGVKQNGIGIYQHTMKDGKRFSLADGYLNDALKKVEIYPSSKPLGLEPHKLNDNNAKFVAVNVKSFAHALNIIWDEEKKDENIAIGIKYFYDGEVHDAFIAPKGEVIICGGVINSAQILMLSGIGPINNLKEHNIKIRKELPIGRNLLNHPACCMAAKVPVPNVSQIHHWSSGFDYGIFHKANVEGKIPSKEEFLDERPDIQMFVSTTVLDSSIAAHIDPTKEKFEVLTTFQILNIPSSVGYLELCSSNPFIQPKIFSNFYEKPDDLYKMMSSLKLSCEIFKQPPLSTVWGIKEIILDDEWCNLDKEISDEDWEQYIHKKLFSGHHPCGTVKMAPESQGGCVNHRLQVYGTKNLRVVDASIFPVIPSGNINAPTAMVAWKASRLIEEDYINKVNVINFFV